MSSKVQRQQAIAKLIGKHSVTNQPQLVDLLAVDGIAATQATVSRDLEDLGAVKVRVPGARRSTRFPSTSRPGWRRRTSCAESWESGSRK